MDFNDFVEQFPEAAAAWGGTGRGPASRPTAAPRREHRAAASSFGKSVRGVLLRLAGLLGRRCAREDLVTDGAAAAAITTPADGTEPGR